MPINPIDIWVYRIISIENLKDDLINGLICKNLAPVNPGRIVIGSKEIISSRDQRPVKCYPETMVNDYVPFYFSVRTPMLLNIVTGMGVKRQKQENIIYLCFKLTDLARRPFSWCFTNANAAEKITRFYNDLIHLDKVDWRSIQTTDFRNNNADRDEDRIRKKHAEFLVKDRVPTSKIHLIAVLNPTVKMEVETIVKKCKLSIEVRVQKDYYFL